MQSLKKIHVWAQMQDPLFNAWCSTAKSSCPALYEYEKHLYDVTHKVQVKK